MLKFYWNGIKDDGGKLQTCHYSDGMLVGHPAETITIYKRKYTDFSTGIKAAFSVKDDSDYQSDYIVREHVRVEPAHPLYAEVHKAYQAQEARHAVQARKRAERWMDAQLTADQ